MPPQTVDGTTFTMQQLAELSQAGYLGQNPEDFIPIPGSYDFSRNDPNLFVERVQDNLYEDITNSFISLTDSQSSNIFGGDGDFSQAGGYYQGSFIPWDGSIERLDKVIEIGSKSDAVDGQKRAAVSAKKIKTKFEGNTTLQLLVQSNFTKFLLDKQVDQDGNKKFPPNKISLLENEHRDKVINNDFADPNLFTVHQGFVDAPGSSSVSQQDLINHGKSFAESMISNIQQYTTEERARGTRKENSKLIIKRELPLDGRVFANMKSVEDFLKLLNIDPESNSYNGFRPTDTITFLHPASERGKMVLVSATLSQLTPEGMQQFKDR